VRFGAHALPIDASTCPLTYMTHKVTSLLTAQAIFFVA
jgi:hypothetical protein